MAAAMLASKALHAARLLDKLLWTPRLRPAAAIGARSFSNHSDDDDDDNRSLEVDRRLWQLYHQDQLSKWDARDGDDGLYLRIDMPGLGKEDVKVTVEQNTLVVRGKHPAEEFDLPTDAGAPASWRRYKSRIKLPTELYRLDGMKAEMKNGALKMFVPNVKEEEERKDIVQVQIE